MRLLHHSGAAGKSKDMHVLGAGNGILYPTMLIAAIAVISFSLFGIATMAGYLPDLLSQGDETMSAASSAEPAEPAAANSSHPMCANCGVISSMHPVEETGPPGTGSSEKTLRGVIDRPSGGQAPAGVNAAGNLHTSGANERNARTSVHYQIKVHMSDGSYRNFDYGTVPKVAVGQQVKVVDGRIVAGD